jgi:HK97 gp10 family phage protein
VSGRPAIKVEGLAELREKLLALGPEVGAKALQGAAREAMKPVLETAKRLAPYDTGDEHTGAHLRDSIVLTAKIPKGGDTLCRVGIRIRALKRPSLKGTRGKVSKATKRYVFRGSAAWRWHFAEFGTAHQRARPFLRPAFAQHREEVVDSLKREIAKRVERIWKNRKKQAAIALAVFGEGGTP